MFDFFNPWTNYYYCGVFLVCYELPRHFRPFAAILKFWRQIQILYLAPEVEIEKVPRANFKLKPFLSIAKEPLSLFAKLEPENFRQICEIEIKLLSSQYHFGIFHGP